jgi:signal recognition particle subunit SRP54
MERMVAIIKSMTIEERRSPRMIDGSRKRRIAAGSGNSIQAVNQLLKQFWAMQKMFGNIGKMKIPGLPKGISPF